ncbi:hypothetical protein ACFX1Z_004606 [Malus domestica]
MAHSAEPSSSLSFTSSPHLSNGSISHNLSCSGSESVPSLEVISLSKLSSSLEQLLIDPGCDYSDADIVVEGIPVGVHRCILASRSGFFRELFKREKGSSGKEDRPKYCMSDFLPYGDVGYEAFLVFLSYVYTGKLKPSPVEVSTCVHNVCAHDACRPAINFVVELMYAASIFQMPDLVSIFERRLLNFVGKALSDNVVPILLVAFHCQLNQLIDQCVDRVARSDIDDISLEKGLPDEVVKKIKILRRNYQQDSDPNLPPADPLHEKRIRRIHKALDSDDVELVKLLLTESNITLDEANALHYAAAYCDPKVVTEVLALGLADVNLRNSRGYTVLHIAVMRKEPSIIVLLLTKGARASELTSDGQSAVSICRRLTRPKDYHSKTEQGQEANKDRICIDVLEREMRRNPMAGDASISSQIMPDDLHMELLNLENRVALARLFFPAEAKLAMVIAHAETSEFAAPSSSKGSSGNLMEVDLNETPTVQNKRLHSRLEALMKTVRLGRCYFPHCSEVLDKFIDDDLPHLFYLEPGSSDEQKVKRRRFMELKEEVQKAFDKDKAECNLSGLSSSSSTTSPEKIGANQKVREPFTSSSHISNGSVTPNSSSPAADTPPPTPDLTSLTNLSSSLGRLLADSGGDYSDAEITVEGVPVAVHRCILASRSEFFAKVFSRENGGSEKEGKPRYFLSDLLPFGHVGYEAFVVFLGFVYTAKLKAFPVEVSSCVHIVCGHEACRPAIDFALELMCASSVFGMPELASVLQRQLADFVVKAVADDVIPILVVAFNCQLSQLIDQCIERVAHSDLDSISLEKRLPDEVVAKIKILRRNSQHYCDPNMPIVDPLREKRIRRIHKALDSDDVELMKLLLTESDVTLDEANALHYAAAYCDPKVVTEVLGLGLADVNLRDSRGFTVLHITVMRKEPSIIILLLSNGARASEPTLEGESAVSICRRLTRPKDYHTKTERGQEANKDRICIDVLEREMLRNPMAGEASISSQMTPNDLHMRLLKLENRVTFARLLFPAEAKLAMAIAHADTTSEFAGISSVKGSSGNLMEVDLNETPTVQNKRLLSRLESLVKTVSMGRYYFPHCSEVLDKLIQGDLPDLRFLETGTTDEQKIKRQRFLELKEEVQRAFDKDKADKNIYGLSPSSSSPPEQVGASPKVREL